MRSQLGTVHPFASTVTVETGPLLVLGHPPTRGRRYMANEQLPWLIPFNQQDASGFAWRTRFRGFALTQPFEKKDLLNHRYMGCTQISRERVVLCVGRSQPQACLGRLASKGVLRQCRFPKHAWSVAPASLAGRLLGFDPPTVVLSDSGRAITHRPSRTTVSKASLAIELARRARTDAGHPGSHAWLTRLSVACAATLSTDSTPRHRASYQRQSA